MKKKSTTLILVVIALLGSVIWFAVFHKPPAEHGDDRGIAKIYTEEHSSKTGRVGVRKTTENQSIRKNASEASGEEILQMMDGLSERELFSQLADVIVLEADKRPLEIWQLLDSVDMDGVQKLALYEMLLRRGVKGGHALSLAQAIQDTFGPGTSRNRLIETMFWHQDTDLASLITAARQFDFEDEKSAAWKGIAGNLVKTGDFDLEEIRPFVDSAKPDDLDYCTEALGIWASKAEGADQISRRINQIVALVQDLKFDTKAETSRAKLYKNLLNSSLKRTEQPFEWWHSVNSTVMVDSFHGDKIQIQVLASKMVSSSPEKALTIGATMSAKSAPLFYEEAFGTWLHNDSRSAGTWFQEHSETLSPASTDAIAKVFVHYSLRHGESDSATEWAAQVQDDKLKKTLLDQISKF